MQIAAELGLGDRRPNVRFGLSVVHRTVSLIPTKAIPAGTEVVVPYGRSYNANLAETLRCLYTPGQQFDDQLTKQQLTAKKMRETREFNTSK